MQIELSADFRPLVERASKLLASEIMTLLHHRFGAPPAPVSSPSRRPATPSKSPAAASSKGRKRSHRASAAARDKLAVAVRAGSGMSVAEIIKATGLSKLAVQYQLKVLRAEKRVFMAGTRSTALWAGSPEVARKAVEAARTKR